MPAAVASLLSVLRAPSQGLSTGLCKEILFYSAKSVRKRKNFKGFSDFSVLIRL